jgi:hypothetical protein
MIGNLTLNGQPRNGQTTQIRIYSLTKFRSSYCSQDSLFFLTNTVMIILFYMNLIRVNYGRHPQWIRVESFGAADLSRVMFRIGLESQKIVTRVQVNDSIPSNTACCTLASNHITRTAQFLIQSPSTNWRPCWQKHCDLKQGRRKLLKVGGGPGFEGHFPNKKGHLKIFARKSWRRGGGEGGHTKKIFPDIAFFPKYETIFPNTPKNFPDIPPPRFLRPWS